ncbi:hypothetical protein [uncultured Secundilactobacillus sp.]|uniref:hypothetical protein n=1 Tax=uncultured Secundilactobacillus sp. TaxID=2813935 RepID=UPI0025861BC2|nr:hypothetical protein [uncultured Secundilactobacillus sp.]
MDYNAQQALINLHMTPEEYDEQNFYRFNAVLSARAEKDRPVTDPAAFIKQLRAMGY